MDLSCLFLMVFLVTPDAVELSVWIGVLGWGQPISMRVCWMGTISLAVIKRPTNSASAAEAMTNLIIWVMVRMDKLSQGTGSYLDRKMWALSWLRALEALRYAESKCPASIMSLA